MRKFLRYVYNLNPLYDRSTNSFNLKDKSIWDKLPIENAKFAQQYVPLVSSNSLGAKGTRLAMTLAILSREIYKHIFQLSYILPEDWEIYGILS